MRVKNKGTHKFYVNKQQEILVEIWQKMELQEDNGTFGQIKWLQSVINYEKRVTSRTIRLYF